MYMEKVPVFVFLAVLVSIAFVFMINSSEIPAASVTGYFVNSGPPQQDSDTTPKDDDAAANSDTDVCDDCCTGEYCNLTGPADDYGSDILAPSDESGAICTEPPDECVECVNTCVEFSEGDYHTCYMCCTANECDAASSDKICIKCALNQ